MFTNVVDPGVYKLAATYLRGSPVDVAMLPCLSLSLSSDLFFPPGQASLAGLINRGRAQMDEQKTGDIAWVRESQKRWAGMDG